MDESGDDDEEDEFDESSEESGEESEETLQSEEEEEELLSECPVCGSQDLFRSLHVERIANIFTEMMKFRNLME